jgi:hypothetical protein
VGSMRQEPDAWELGERQRGAVAYLKSIRLPKPNFLFFDAGMQGGVKATWPWGDTVISHAARFSLATPYVVTVDELEVVASYLRDWFAERSKLDDAPKKAGDDNEQVKAETEAAS